MRFAIDEAIMLRMPQRTRRGRAAVWGWLVIDGVIDA